MKFYTSPTCYKCKQLKKFLQENNISFEEVDIASNSSAIEKLIAKGLSALPVLELNGEFHQGVEISQAKKLLKL